MRPAGLRRSSGPYRPSVPRWSSLRSLRAAVRSARALKPYVKGLPPFVSSFDLSRHIAAGILNKHGGSIEAARSELAEALAPLHDVFSNLASRIRADELKRPASADPLAMLSRDAVPNSITKMDAFAQRLAIGADEVFSEVSAELGWSERKPPPAAPPSGLWQRLSSLFKK